MFKKTLIAMMCSLSLVACGGGGSSSDEANNGSIATPVSDLDKAKQLIETTKAVISYYDGFEAIGDQYKVPAETINATASDLNNATGLIVFLADLAYADAQGASKDYTAQQLEDLMDAYNLENRYIADYDLQNSTLSVKVTAGSIKVSGMVNASYWSNFKENIDWQNPNWIFDKNNFEFKDKALVAVTNLVLEAPLRASQNSFDFKIANGGSIETTNAIKQKAKFSFTADSTASLVYATSDNLDNQNIPNQASLKLQGLVFESGEVKAILNEVSASAKKVKFNNGIETLEQLIPTELVLKGAISYLKESLNLEAKLKLNNDFTKVIDVSAGQETATNFINAILNVKLSGNLKGANAAPTPFSIDINAKRAEFVQGIATVAIIVDKHALDLELTTQDLDKDQQVLSGVIKHKNGASIKIADIDTFTSAQVNVGNSSYGTVTKNSSGQYVVKFTDNTIVYITP